MSPRARTAKLSVSSSNSPSKSKKKSSPLRKITRRSTVQKKSSPVKQSSSIQPRQKRLSSLTAATLLQYCTSILSPARKLKLNSKKIINEKSSTSRKRQISNGSENQIELPISTRIRREASSHASAMIMQQNEIERSRCNYSSISIQRYRSKNTVTNKDDPPSEPVKFNIPSVPPPSTIISTSANYPLLTEAILAEHNRLQETITTKNDKLLKWTEELARCGRLSPPYPEDEIPITKPSNSKEITPSILLVNTSSRSLEQLSNTINVPAPTFLFPSSAYSLDLRSFYPLMPCWQYPSKPHQ
jgi:hypothetical protein